MYIEVYVDILFLICLVPELLSLWLLGCLEHSWEEGKYRRSDNRKIRKIWIFWHLLWISSLFAGLSVTAAILLRQIGFWGLLAVDFLLQLFAFRLLFGRQSLRRKVTLWGLQKLFFLVLGGLFEAGWKRGRISAGSLFAGFVGGGVFFLCFPPLSAKKKTVGTAALFGRAVLAGKKLSLSGAFGYRKPIILWNVSGFASFSGTGRGA